MAVSSNHHRQAPRHTQASHPLNPAQGKVTAKVDPGFAGTHPAAKSEN